MKGLEFIVIGAQKAGTTTLFKYLQEHPQLYLPPEKEAPFFSRDEAFAKGWAWYARTFFADAPADALWGTATPQYMGYPQAAPRLAGMFPAVKLIAILRDPVDRAYSHYGMSVKRGLERRSFAEAVRAQLTPEGLAASRQDPTPSNSYVTWGEYGRILTHYLEVFPREQLLVLFMGDLSHQPEGVMHRLYDFLGVAHTLPKVLGQRFHQGGSQQRLPGLKALLKKTPVTRVWQRLPERTRRRAGYWFEQWNTTTIRKDAEPIPAETEAALRGHFATDAVLLVDRVGVRPPWQARGG